MEEKASILIVDENISRCKSIQLIGNSILPEIKFFTLYNCFGIIFFEKK